MTVAAGPRSQNDPFPPSLRGRWGVLATKPGHLLRLTRYLQPYPRFIKNRRLSTCGFLFALLVVVEGGGLNAVDGRVSWRADHADAPTRPKNGPPSFVPGESLGLELQRESDRAVVAAKDVAADAGVAHVAGD